MLMYGTPSPSTPSTSPSTHPIPSHPSIQSCMRIYRPHRDPPSPARLAIAPSAVESLPVYGHRLAHARLPAVPRSNAVVSLCSSDCQPPTSLRPSTSLPSLEPTQPSCANRPTTVLYCTASCCLDGARVPRGLLLETTEYVQGSLRCCCYLLLYYLIPLCTSS